MYVMNIYCGNIFEELNYFRKIIQIICYGDKNSRKIGKLIEELSKKNPKNSIFFRKKRFR